MRRPRQCSWLVQHGSGTRLAPARPTWHQHQPSRVCSVYPLSATKLVHLPCRIYLLFARPLTLDPKTFHSAELPLDVQIRTKVFHRSPNVFFSLISGSRSGGAMKAATVSAGTPLPVCWTWGLAAVLD